MKIGVSNFIIAGYSIDSSKKALEIANNYDGLYTIIGVSPNDIEKIKSEEDIKQMVKQIEELYEKDSKEKKKVVAIGEIGLDYYWNKENKQLQRKVFVEQINLANRLKLPIVIHTRDAVNDTLEILKENRVIQKGIFHCCPLNIELVKEALKLGYYISLSGTITFKNSKNANEIITIIPDDRILIETDSPYLSPEPVRGKRNNSMNVKYVAQKIAEIKNKSLEEIAETTMKNTKKIFNIL